MAAEARAILDAAMSEDDLLTQVLELCRVTGWRVYHVRNSKRAIVQGPGAEGFPDLVMAKRAGGGSPGRILFRELKTEKGKLSPEQAEWGALLLAARQDWALWRPSDWRTIRDELEGVAATTANVADR